MGQIRIGENHWAWPHDLRSKPFGREDPEELVEECVDYLEARARTASARRANRTTGHIVARRVRAAVARSSTGSQPGPNVIDRLLAYVPRREEQIPQGRLQEIVRVLLSQAKVIFGSEDIVPMLAMEEDLESPAAHRVTLFTRMDSPDADRWAESTLALHRWVADALGPEESRALRVVVTPVEN